MSRTIVAISIILILLGTHLFTYASTRYATTCSVLTSAKARVYARLEKAGQLEAVLRADGLFPLAITQAGGMYHGWNELLPVFGGAVFATASGAACLFYGLRRRESRAG